MFAFFRLIYAAFIFTRYGIVANLLENFPASAPFLRFLTRLLTRKTKTPAQADAPTQSQAEAQAQAKGAELAAAIYKLGPSYIKLAQFLATRPDIVGPKLSAQLSLLQDCVPAFAQKDAWLQIQRSLNKTASQLEAELLEFSQPVAAASIAQVHQAYSYSASGQKIKLAVKVLRPGIKLRFAKDLQSFYLVARLVERFIKPMRRLRPIAVVQSFEQTVRMEMDLRLEAAAIAEMAQNVKNDARFKVPQIYWALTGQKVLTMQWIDGVKLNDKPALKKLGIQPKLLAQTLMQSFLRHAMRDGFFHADMHPGNLFVNEMSEIIAIDFGITGRLGRKERYFLAQILYGFIKRDYMAVAQAHFDAGYVPKHYNVADFAQANRAIGEPIHGQSAKDISMARLLGLLFEITEIFEMQTRPELLLLQKNLVIVEGLARELDSEFNMWQTAKPIVKEWMAENMGPKALAKQVQNTGQKLRHFALSAPELIDNWQETQKMHALTTSRLYARLSRNLSWLGAALWLLILIALYVLLFKY